MVKDPWGFAGPGQHSGRSCVSDGSSFNIRIAQTFPPSSILDIHAVRPHRGQVEVAFRFRSLLDSDHHPSEIAGLGMPI